MVDPSFGRISFCRGNPSTDFKTPYIAMSPRSGVSFFPEENSFCKSPSFSNFVNALCKASLSFIIPFFSVELEREKKKRKSTVRNPVEKKEAIELVAVHEQKRHANQKKRNVTFDSRRCEVHG
jgi:hypothetical protein